VRLVFESALELMGTTQLGSFKARAATFGPPGLGLASGLELI